MSLSFLPTELRQMIIEEVLTTPLSPPSVPSEVRDQNWSYPHKLCGHLHMGRNPEVAFNTQEPWGSQYLSLLLANKAFRADTEEVLKRIGRQIRPTLDVMLNGDGNLRATWLLVSPPAIETEHLNVNLRTLDCMKIWGDEGSTNVETKRNANMLVGRLLHRITSVGLNPYAKCQHSLGTRIHELRITVVAPTVTENEGTVDEKAPLAARLSEYLSMGYLGKWCQKIDAIDIFVDDRKAYAFSSAKNSFVLDWSHTWRRDSAMEE
ncbi:uncharacterized protein N0V89_002009 [Didymosphaeria variabile]|uniref:Uncharacterized protein n=1 Tax=Didymosphaeria variabile TaxID=1932322 RepID=A0A9W8XRZ2_9PLEO|nr:uncharacterized protein N0V89_002009 [Didymosphaeria variabile]KAJ4357434.1 hypothetical protein N0V89_002009 [Didymosphaeria variabile]